MSSDLELIGYLLRQQYSRFILLPAEYAIHYALIENKASPNMPCFNIDLYCVRDLYDSNVSTLSERRLLLHFSILRSSSQ